MIGTVGLRRKVAALEQVVEARLPDVGAAPVVHDHDERYHTKDVVDAAFAALPAPGGGVTLAEVIAALYPVGSIVFRTENPGTTWGVGTWEAFGAGRVFVGLNAGDSDFDALNKTGGAKTHTLSVNELPAHNHPVSDPGHQHVETQNSATTGPLSGWGARDTSTNTEVATSYQTQSAVTGVTIGNTGGGAAHNNMPPFVVVQAWRRTA